MPPDQLASIRTFEGNESKADSKQFNEVEEKSDSENQSNKKRKHNESEDDQNNGSEIYSEEIKKKKLERFENNQVEGEQNVNLNSTEESNKNNLCNELKKDRKKEKKVQSLDDSSLDIPVNREEKQSLMKRKKCYSESSALEDTPKKRRKFKSENDAMDGEEVCEEKGGNCNYCDIST